MLVLASTPKHIIMCLIRPSCREEITSIFGSFISNAVPYNLHKIKRYIDMKKVLGFDENMLTNFFHVFWLLYNNCFVMVEMPSEGSVFSYLVLTLALINAPFP